MRRQWNPWRAQRLGPDYSARFDAGGVTFTPALGSRVERAATLQLRFAEVRRRDAAPTVRAASVTPVADGNRVRFVHDADVTEVYDVREDGIEQSFVLATRPAGNGDLVVRCALTTELPLAAASDDEVRFEVAGAGGVRFGAVTGVDANGARCRGRMHCTGDALELLLPASFVDSAAYPLVLDPLIGSSFLIANIAGGSDVQPSIAYSADNLRYLVVWSVPMSASAAEVRAQMVTAAGALGPQTLLTSAATPGVRPAAVHVRDTDQFVVSWASGSAGVLCTIDAQSGALSTSLLWNLSPRVVTGMALGGDRRFTAGGFGFALWVVTTRDPTTGRSSALQRLAVTDSFFYGLGSTTAIYSDVALDFGAPAVSKHVGDFGDWLFTVGWRNQASPSTVGLNYGRVTSSTGNLCSLSATNWTAAGNSYSLHSAVATSGDGKFLVGYETGAGTIALRHVTLPPLCSSGPPILGTAFDPTAAGGADDLPELDYTGDRFLLAWRHAAPTANVKVMSIGHQLQPGAGAEYFVQGPTASAQYDPAVAAQQSGSSAAGDEALVVWASAGIRARRWDETGTGTVTNIGGACGISGLNDYASYTGTPVIGTTFTVDLLSPTAPVLALVVGFSQNPFACGPCTIVPSPDILLAGGGPVPVAVPLDAGLIGVELYTQWLQWRQAGCALLPDFGFSNALKFTIAE